MFSKLKHRLDGSGKRAIAFTLAALLLCGIAGCTKEPSGSPAENNDTSADISNSNDTTGFDIDRVRKNIIIKGQTIEIPTKLKDLPKGWTYKLYDEKDVFLKDDQYLATMFYNDEEMYIATLENYKKNKPKESIIYNLTIYDNDCSIDGLTPSLSSKQEVEKKYGQPIEISSYGSYTYGVVEKSSMAGRLNEQSIGIKFNDDDIITSISITYADLDKQY